MKLEEFLRDLGSAIAAQRRVLKLTQEELAERLKTSPEWVSQIERGVGAPSLETLLRIADALGVTLSDLVTAATSAAPSRVESAELLARVRQLDSRALRLVLDVVRAVEREYGGRA